MERWTVVSTKSEVTVAKSDRLRACTSRGLRVDGFDERPSCGVLRDVTAVFAAPFACLASVANAAGLEIASSDRLLRSSVTPAFFRPLINCP